MADLTPAEQAFFATGDASHLNAPAPGVQGVDSLAPPAPPASSANGPLEHQALSQGTPPAPAPAPAPSTTVAPAPATTTVDPTEHLRQSLAATQQQAAMLEGQLRAVLAQQQQAQQAANQPQEPDAATDPIGNMMYKMDVLQKQLSTLTQQQSQTATVQQQEQFMQSFQRQVVAMKDQFAAQHADYDAAVTHLRNARIADLRMFGLTDQQIAQQINSEEWSIAVSAVQSGRNPAEVIYDMSKRHGYAGQPAATPGAPPAPKQGASLEAIQRAQAAARDPAAAPQPPADVTVEGLRQMGDADLNKLVMDPNAWQKIAGGNNYPL